jgi:pyruvate kinase
MVTDHIRAYYQMEILWGGKAFYSETMDTATDEVIRSLLGAGNIAKGDAVVVASGHQPGVSGGTDKLEIRIA